MLKGEKTKQGWLGATKGWLYSTSASLAPESVTRKLIRFPKANTQKQWCQPWFQSGANGFRPSTICPESLSHLVFPWASLWPSLPIGSWSSPVHGSCAPTPARKQTRFEWARWCLKPPYALRVCALQVRSSVNVFGFCARLGDQYCVTSAFGGRRGIPKVHSQFGDQLPQKVYLRQTMGFLAGRKPIPFCLDRVERHPCTYTLRMNSQN